MSNCFIKERKAIETYTILAKKLSKEKILGCIVRKNGEVVFEYYKNRKTAAKHHKINSCTKSILSSILGIAFDRGYLRDLHQPITDYFPKELLTQPDIRKRDLTIHHLLTMTPGFHFPEWEEWNGFAPMAQGGDIIKFVLNRDLIHEPGEMMSYNSGCSHLLTYILQEAAGKTALEFAQQELFHPLGIEDPVWYSDSKGVNRGADGIRLTMKDMLTFGTLYLQNGEWGGRRLISSKWITDSLKPRFLTYEHIGFYSYHWWTAKINVNSEDLSDDNLFHFALGYGGQYIIIVPSMGMVCVFVSEMYHASLKPLALFREFILTPKRKEEFNA
jgi:CubicO group peptidase (beta-lactamase class C family)